MSTIGSAFRDRYLRPSRADQDVGIVGIRSETLDNSQLFIHTSTDAFSTASAAAFVQGLYPPLPQVPCDRTVSEYHRLTNGSSFINYPMFGYQYPNIRTSDPGKDPDSIW
jgi:hypothetical protein